MDRIDNHRFRLQKYKTKSDRYTCPQCGRKFCFTRYVDSEGNWLGENVGRCDHESSCGYHYTPRAFFRDHPSASWENKNKQANLKKTINAALSIDKSTIPFEYVMRSVRTDTDSNLTRYLKEAFPSSDVLRAVEEYYIGVTNSGDTIYFEIDTEGHCRTGKIMRYDLTGHRIKDENSANRIDWVHKHLRLPNDWTLSQCLFGEHLLKKYPNKDVALVESEKTAIICSIVMPEFVWLATGGKSQLNDRVRILSGKRVTVFPDADAIEAWKQKVREYPEVGFIVSDILKKADTAHNTDNMDIADWILDWVTQRST